MSVADFATKYDCDVGELRRDIDAIFQSGDTGHYRFRAIPRPAVDLEGQPRESINKIDVDAELRSLIQQHIPPIKESGESDARANYELSRRPPALLRHALAYLRGQSAEVRKNFIQHFTSGAAGYAGQCGAEKPQREKEAVFRLQWGRLGASNADTLDDFVKSTVRDYAFQCLDDFFDSLGIDNENTALYQRLRANFLLDGHATHEGRGVSFDIDKCLSFLYEALQHSYITQWQRTDAWLNAENSGYLSRGPVAMEVISTALDTSLLLYTDHGLLNLLEQSGIIEATGRGDRTANKPSHLLHALMKALDRSALAEGEARKISDFVNVLSGEIDARRRVGRLDRRDVTNWVGVLPESEKSVAACLKKAESDELFKEYIKTDEFLERALCRGTADDLRQWISLATPNTELVGRLFQLASAASNSDMMDALYEVPQLDITRQDEQGHTILHTMALSGQTEKFNHVSNHPQFANVLAKRTLSGDTVLHSAVRSGNADMVALVLACGAGRNWPVNNEGSSALHLAIEGGNEEIASQLIAGLSAAEVRKVNRHGNSALHEAARAGMTAIFGSLVAKGQGAAQQNHDGELPLHLALRWATGTLDFALRGEMLDNIESLLGNGLLHVRNNDGNSTRGRIADFMLGIPSYPSSRAESPLDMMLEITRLYGDTRFLDRCAARADLNVTSAKGRTPLSLALSMKRRPMHQATQSPYMLLQFLLEKGVDIGVKTRDTLRHQSKFRSPRSLANKMGDAKVPDTDLLRMLSLVGAFHDGKKTPLDDVLPFSQIYEAQHAEAMEIHLDQKHAADILVHLISRFGSPDSAGRLETYQRSLADKLARTTPFTGRHMAKFVQSKLDIPEYVVVNALSPLQKWRSDIERALLQESEENRSMFINALPALGVVAHPT